MSTPAKAPLTPAPRFFYGYLLAAYSFAVCFLASSFFLHSRGIFFPQWMAEFGVQRTEISAAVTFTLLTGSCVAPISGWLIDRYPLRFIVCVGAVWVATGYALLYTVQSYQQFLLTLIIFQGLGWTCIGPLVHTKLMVNWFSRHRGMALGIAIMGISMAGVVMPNVVAVLSESLGWRLTYALYAGLMVGLVVPASLLLVRQQPQDIGAWPDGADGPPPQPRNAATAPQCL